MFIKTIVRLGYLSSSKPLAAPLSVEGAAFQPRSIKAEAGK